MDQAKPMSDNLERLNEELGKLYDRIGEINAELICDYRSVVKVDKAAQRLGGALSDIAFARQLIFQAKGDIK